MSKFIKCFNDPFLKYQSGNVVRIINIDEIVEIHYWSDRAWIYFKSGPNDEIHVDAAREIDEFLMNHKSFKTTLPGGIINNIELMGEKQTLQQWLEENGQA